MNNQRPIILDGGMGQELVRRMLPTPPSKLWGMQVLLDYPQLVTQLHLEYLEAGSDVITLCNYTCTPQRLKRDATEDLFKPLHERAIACARNALSQFSTSSPNAPTPKIAGCLPPLVASYRTDVIPEMDEALDSYHQILDIQKDHIDIVLIETMSNLTEAEAAVTAAKSTTLPIWIAFKLDDDRAGGYLPDGTPLLDVIAFVTDLKVDAVLLNCSKPEVIDRNVPTLQTFAGQTGVYPNGFESINALDVGGTVSSLKRREDFTIESFTRFMKNAHRQGVSILGGCCETTPEYIRALSQLKF